jgi:DNA-binding transcriptional regulator YiaG
METQLTSAQFKQARRALGLTLFQLGQVLDTDPRTIRKWEAGDEAATSRNPNPIACRVLHWLASGELKLERGLAAFDKIED